jgi:hypothetical protein
VFNTGQHNTRAHNSSTSGVPFECFADTRQVVVRRPASLWDADCRQVIVRDVAYEARTYQVVFAVLRDETHIIQV